MPVIVRSQMINGMYESDNAHPERTTLTLTSGIINILRHFLSSPLQTQVVELSSVSAISKMRCYAGFQSNPNRFANAQKLIQ